MRVILIQITTGIDIHLLRKFLSYEQYCVRQYCGQ